MAERKLRWCYVQVCRFCKQRIEVIADAGTSPDKPGGRFFSGCPRCRLKIEFNDGMLQQLPD